MRFSLPVFLLWACDGGAPSDEDAPLTDDTDLPSDDTDGTPDDTDVPEGCAAIGSVSSERGVQAMEQRIAVGLDAPDTVWATCTSPDDPEELHLVESTEASDAHTLVLRGLLANTAYDCEVHAGCGGPSTPVAFTSGVPEGVPQLSATRTPGTEMSGAYTLFNTQDGCGGNMAWVMIADPEGRVRWMYPVGTDLVTDLDATLIDPNTVHIGGGWGIFQESQSNRGVFRTIDLSGRVLVERELPDFGLGFNHQSTPLADGSYLSLTASVDSLGNHDWTGIGVEQWSPASGLIWTWDSQGLVDDGTLEEPPGFEFFPPYHANSVEFVTDSEGDAMWLSNFGTEELWRIDRASGALTAVFGPDGDFTLRDVAGNPLPDSEYPYVQHGPDYTTDGRVLLYDNGDGRPGGDYSRVAEYRLDLETREATLLWFWTEPGWFDPIIGDADYLPNGNVLVTQGYNRCLFQTNDDVSELVELTPPDTVVWKLTWPSDSHAVYRSQRYDGCDVFGNARYCPSVADRIAELEGGG